MNDLRNRFLILLLLFPLTAGAQRVIVRNMPEYDHRAMHFGFTLGVNTMDFRIRASEYAVNEGLFAEVSTLTPGFNINIVSNFRLGNHFDFRMLPGVAFGQRRINYYRIPGGRVPGESGWDSRSEPIKEGYQDMESSFIEFPFIFKYKSVRINNYRPYLIAGTSLRYDLAKNFSEEDGIYLSLKPFDVYLETGFGIDFYLPFFKFSTELKYATGFLHVLEPRSSRRQRYQDTIERLHSNLFILSFHFE
ncbi:MAG: PorT family protein [Marinilabiliales bacterium]|nr:MAG: PorT family protein [Marinilabiliales bacterium]